MFEYDTVNRWVFRRLRKVSSDGADVASGGRLFQTWGPATGKALSPTVDRLDCSWMRRLVLAERRVCRLGKSATRTNGRLYDGAQPWRTLYVSTAILNWMRCGMRNNNYSTHTTARTSPIPGVAQWASLWGRPQCWHARGVRATP